MLVGNATSPARALRLAVSRLDLGASRVYRAPPGPARVPYELCPTQFWWLSPPLASIELDLGCRPTVAILHVRVSGGELRSGAA
jgi:hypothetical protein